MHKVNSRLSVKISDSGKPKLISTPSIKRNSVLAKTGKVETANLGFGGATGGASGLSVSAIGASQRNNLDLILTGIVNDKQAHIMRMMYRDIYNYDPVGGSAVDMTATLPFSDFSLTGCPDKELEIYVSSIERLSLKTLNPLIHANELVFGEFVATAVFNPKDKVFNDMLIYSLDQCTMQYLPFTSMEPNITVKPNGELKEFLNSNEPEILKLKKHIPNDLLASMSQGEFVLDPLTTIYMARTTLDRSEPTSYFRRLIPIYLLEKTLTRGTLVEATKRQRAFLHAIAGNEDWEPTEEELSAVAEMFQKADLDPLGPVIVTRDGIQLSEARQGGDFWKSTDVYDITTSLKLRALQISESFLSGDVNYACLTGDTLIATEHGLIPIELLANENDTSKKQTIDIVVSGRYKPEKAVKWLYSGYAPTLKIDIQNTPSIKCTDIHPILVLKENETKWVQAKNLEIGDLICKPTKNLVQNTEILNLNLRTPPVDSNSSRARSVLTMPKYMSPELAYLIGCIVAEGSIIRDENRRTYRVGFSNTEKSLLNTYDAYMKKVFGVECYKYKKAKYTKSHKTCFDYNLNSKTLCEWLEDLGLYAEKSVDGYSTSHYKVIPWSILQADRDSQLAFIASYIECDGYFGNKRIIISSVSKRLIDEMQTLLSTFGIVSTLATNKRSGVINLIVNSDFANSLYDLVKPYLVFKKFKKIYTNKARNSFGFPVDYLKSFIKSRQLTVTRYGTTFINDHGEQVLIQGWKNPCNTDKKFLYDKYNRGDYKRFLSQLRLISEIEYKKLVELFELQYSYTPVTCISDNGKQHVYDISMEKGKEPAFVANSVIVHNTAEINLSVYMENLKYNRSSYTQKLFYNKLFPVIAAVNGFVDTNKKQSKGSVHHKVRDGSKYRIPKVHWHKNLDPVSDTQTIEMLNMLSEKGIPVPLRLWAAAGGMSLESIEEDLDKDIEIRKQFAQYNQELQKAAQELGGDEFADDEFAKLNKKFVNKATAKLFAPSGAIVPKSIFQRDYGENSEIFTRSVTGKKKHVFRQAVANKKINEVLAKALENLSDKNHYTNTVKKARRYGHKIL